MKPRPLALFLALAALPLCGTVYGNAAESPPPDNTTLKFQKTLFVHKGEKSKIFAETRKISGGDTIWRILREDYGVSEDLMVTLVDVFREVNPGVNPNQLVAGQVVKVPFKVESDLGAAQAAPAAAPSDPGGNYVVRPGDTLWKVLKNVFGVKKDEMSRVMAKVSAANKGVKDMNRLWVGQVIVMPADLKSAPPKPQPEKPAPDPAQPGVPGYFSTVLDLFAKLGCKVEQSGETFVPVERGRTVRLAASDFPIVVGPSGKKVILDPGERLTQPLRTALASSWGYATIQGAKYGAEEYVGNLINALGFYEAKKGARAISLGEGLTLIAETAFHVTPKPGDVWENRIHLIFPKGKGLDPALLAIVKGKGFSVHILEGEVEQRPSGTRGQTPQSLDFGEPAKGLAQFLNLLGIRAEVDRELDCRLESGVVYKVRSPLSFEYKGLSYAVPPKSPARAESILTRSGHFTFSLGQGVPNLARVLDLARLLNLPAQREEVEVPAEGGLKLKVDGVKIASDLLADALYPPSRGEKGQRQPIFVTGADLDSSMSSLLMEGRVLPLLLK